MAKDGEQTTKRQEIPHRPNAQKPYTKRRKKTMAKTIDRGEKQQIGNTAKGDQAPQKHKEAEAQRLHFGFSYIS